MPTSRESERTTVEVPRELKSRFDDLKPYPSMTYADLLEDMAATYEEERGAP